MKPIILTGFMGSGKSTVGRLLAKKTNRRFVDSDAVIAERAGMPIPRIFQTEGEEGFRQRETAALKELLTEPSMVLATGGGAVLRPENRELFLHTGIVVFLKASPDVIYRRVSDSHDRPLADGQTFEHLSRLYEKRMSCYEQCHICYQTGNHSPLQCANDLQKMILEGNYGN